MLYLYPGSRAPPRAPRSAPSRSKRVPESQSLLWHSRSGYGDRSQPHKLTPSSVGTRIRSSSRTTRTSSARSTPPICWTYMKNSNTAVASPSCHSMHLVARKSSLAIQGRLDPHVCTVGVSSQSNPPAHCLQAHFVVARWSNREEARSSALRTVYNNGSLCLRHASTEEELCAAGSIIASTRSYRVTQQVHVCSPPTILEQASVLGNIERMVDMANMVNIVDIPADARQSVGISQSVSHVPAEELHGAGVQMRKCTHKTFSIREGNRRE